MRLRQLLKTCLLFTVVWTSSYGQAAANLEMAIHVYDYAGIHPGKLAEAEAFAARILEESGLGTKWSNCRLSPAANAPTRCAAAAGVIHLYIRLLPEKMARKFTVPSSMLGMSLPTSEGTFPVDAYVFAERVGVLAQQDQIPLPPLLGAAITHEVGHLLLANEAHTVSGIMRAQWGRRENNDALMGALRFSRGQSEQMRVNLNHRISGSNQSNYIAHGERGIQPSHYR